MVEEDQKPVKGMPDTAAVVCCIWRKTLNRVEMFLIGGALSGGRGKPCRACKNEQIASRLCVELICCPLLKDRVCLVTENSLFRGELMIIRIEKEIKQGGEAESAERESTCRRKNGIA